MHKKYRSTKDRQSNTTCTYRWGAKRTWSISLGWRVRDLLTVHRCQDLSQLPGHKVFPRKSVAREFLIHQQLTVCFSGGCSLECVLAGGCEDDSW